ncbi:unnamed protein product [Ceutorhynchus assimilis]|uniref:Uncharacterized protein n=1 Tax=Ceutorhynchus assimilis TaxID=467358 RepID=A0A9N9QK01_9CUCU|nr:unnamed protein product [Ceutorhynchus assimilis]
MAKVQALLFVAAFLPILIAYPLEDSSSTETHINKDEEKTDKNSYIEETYIEVLLPGVSRLNSSSINALLSKNNTTESDEDKTIDDKESNEDSSKEAHPGLVSAQVSASPRPLSRAVRDITYNQNPANLTQNGSPSSLPANKNSHPALLSASRAIRDVDEGKESSSTTEEQKLSTQVRDSVDQTQSGSTSSTTEADVGKQQKKAQPSETLTRAARDVAAQKQNSFPIGSSSTTERAVLGNKLSQSQSPFAVEH